MSPRHLRAAAHAYSRNIAVMEVQMPAAWDVFIAYASVDRYVADALYEALRKLPQPSPPRVFLDHEVLEPGDDWPKSLTQAQAAARCVVALISPASQAAFFQREEILRALDAARATPRRQRLVPVYLDGARPDGDEVPYGLRALHALAAPHGGGGTIPRPFGRGGNQFCPPGFLPGMLTPQLGG